MPDQFDELAEFEEIADQLQVGDRAEGAAALKRLMERSGGGQDVAGQVRATIARDRVQEELNSALKDFERKNPNLVKDELLAEAGLTAVRNQIARDFEDLGIPAEKIAPLKGSSETMVKAYAELRAAGQRVRPPAELLDAAAQELRTKFNIRTPSSRNPRDVIREMRETRGPGFRNDEAHMPAARSEMTEAEKKRQERAQQYLHNARRVRGYASLE